MVRMNRFVKRKQTGTLFICGMCLCFLTSCSIGTYNPNPAKAKGIGKNLEAFSGTIEVINDQPDKTNHTMSFRKTVVNYYDCTQSVVEALRGELQQKSQVVSKNGDKRLYVKVNFIDFNISGGGFTYQGTIQAIVKTGDGTKQFFDNSRSSYASGFNMTIGAAKPLDAAFKDIVRDILHHEKIQTYLK